MLTKYETLDCILKRKLKLKMEMETERKERKKKLSCSGKFTTIAQLLN